MRTYSLAVTLVLALGGCKSEAPAPEPVADLDNRQLSRWRSYVADKWWEHGEPVRCDGELKERVVLGALAGTMGKAYTCESPSGESKAWFPNGAGACPAGAKLVGAPPPVHDGVMCWSESKGHGHGPTTFFTDGRAEKRMDFEDGKPSGLEVILWPNGRLRTVATYRDGKLHGTVNYWFPDGMRSLQQTYVDGELHGLLTSWLPSREIGMQVRYEHGKEHGPRISWGLGGRHCGTDEADHGTGPWRRFWQDCQLQERGQYEDGEGVGEWVRFDKQGNELWRGPFERMPRNLLSTEDEPAPGA